MMTRRAASILLGSLLTPIAATLITGIASAETVTRPIEFPAVSQLLPDSVVGVVFVNPNPQLWQDLTKFKAFPQDFTTPSWMFSSLASGLNYHGDIAPWIGGPVGNVVMFNSDQTKTIYATITPVKDPSQMPRFFDRLKRSRTGTLTGNIELPTTQMYKGNSILFWKPKQIPDYFSEALDNLQKVTPQEARDIPAIEPTKDKGTKPKKSNTESMTKKAGEAADKAEEAARKAGEAAKGNNRDQAPELELPKPIPKPSKPKKTIEIGGFAAAYLKSGFVVTSESISAVEQLIDAEVSTSLRLASVPGFQRMIQDDRYPKALISGYANLGGVIKTNQLNIPAAFKGLSNLPLFQTQTPEQLNQLITSGSDGIDGFVWAVPEGIQAQIGIHFKSAMPPLIIKTVNSPNALLSRIPAVNYGMSGSTDLAFFWRALSTALETNPNTKQRLQQFRDGSRSFVGIDDRDIFPWMDKEYIGFVFPSNGSPLKQLDPKLAIGFGAFFQTSDRPAATAALKKVETALIKLSKGAFQVNTRSIANTNSIANTSMTSWELTGVTKPNKSKKQTPTKPISFFAYQWTNDNTLAILSGADTANNLLPKPWQSLDQAKNFQDAIAPLPKENMGYAYLNPPALLALANQFGLTKLLQPANTSNDSELDISNIVNSIFSIAGTSALQPTQLTSEGYFKLATRPIPKLTAQQFIDRANSKAEINDGDWAIANFTRALTIEPNNADAYYDRATAQQNSKNFLGAIEDYDRTLQLEPKKVQAYLDRSKSKQQTYDYLGSLTDANKAIDLTTKPELKADAYELRSIAQFNQGNYTEALNDLDQSKKGPDNLNYNCALAARAAKPNALEICEEAASVENIVDRMVVRADPSLPPELSTELAKLPAELSSHLCLARAQNKDPKAFKECGNAINQEPDNPIVHEVQGLARMAAGDKKGAIFSLEKALKLYTVLGDQTAIGRVQAAIGQNQ